MYVQFFGSKIAASAQAAHSRVVDMMMVITGALVSLLAAVLFALLAVSRQRALVQATTLTEELQKTNTELKRSNADLSQFAHIASHDLQTPVRNVIAAADMLEQHLGDTADEDSQEFLGYLQASATRMNKLVSNLLDYAKVGQDPIHMSTVELDSVLQDVVRATQNLCNETGTTLSVGKLPPVVADADQLERVFLNLVINAIRYAHPNRKPQIELASRIGSDDSVEITVSDNGRGIESQHFNEVFEPFKRLHRQDEIAGTGLGLGICKQIVEHHGGSIIVADSDCNGTTFLITLPR